MLIKKMCLELDLEECIALVKLRRMEKKIRCVIDISLSCSRMVRTWVSLKTHTESKLGFKKRLGRRKNERYINS